MHALRSARTLARLVLAWFMLTLAVAGAAPMVNPQAMQLVCAAGGTQIVLVDGGSGADGSGMTVASLHTLACPMCLAAMIPAVPPIPSFARPLPQVQTPGPLPAARSATLAGAPLPPRGPPATA